MPGLVGMYRALDSKAPRTAERSVPNIAGSILIKTWVVAAVSGFAPIVYLI
jgi:hypothetical protein